MRERGREGGGVEREARERAREREESGKNQGRISKLRDLLVSKETYYSVKRDLLQCQKRPTREEHPNSVPIGSFTIHLKLCECVP